MIECTCLNCNKSFQVKQSNIERGKGKYCSIDCYNAMRVKWTKHTCRTCGIEFNVKQSTHDNGGGKYCSRKCSSVAQKTEVVDRKCLRCGETFSIIPSLAKEGGNYCSRSCYEKSTKVERICQQCHKPFWVYPSQLVHDTTIYCSKKCAGLARIGKNNPHWKGGGGDKRGDSWHQQRNLARKRDGGVCQMCHRKPRKGEAKFPIHHIKPFRTFNGDHIEANDLSNLITLCRKCHPKAEYGKVAIQLPLNIKEIDS